MMDFLKQIKSVGFAILAVLTAHFGQSQSLSPQSISTQGGGHKSPNYQVNYTIGQVVQGGGATTGYRITNGLQNDYSGPPEIEVTSLGNQVIRVGSRLEFYVTPPASAPSATLSYQVAGSPFGQVAFDPATGLFSFTPDQQDTEPFYVSFFATDGVTVIEQKVQISTFPTLESVPGEDFGFTQGYFNVNEGGGATYVVPVKLPLGTGGMKPDLSMVYSSTGSNGILGVGWSLGGLSMISRSPATYEQDKLLDGVNFNENDRFNMDGERLVSIGGGVYGANGTEYRTESNNFSRVISFMENGVTSRFLVKTKSGLTYEYGFTKDSRIEAQGRQEVLFWAVNKIYDTNGNTISFLYEENNATGEFYPLRIEYAGNLNAGLAPAYKVQFEYEYRPDASEQYIYGSKVLKARRLKKIGVTAANTILREYLFKYKLDIRTKLVSIREIGSNGKSLRPVNFTWNDSLKFDLTQVENILPSVPNGYSVNPVDWNRDGFTDLMFYNKTNGDNIFYMNRGNLVFAEDAAYKLPASMIMQGNGISMGDWNGDAKTDLLWWNSADGTNRWFVNTGSGFELYNKVVVPSDQIRGGELHMGDWNGDALTDVMWYNKATGDNTWFFNLFGVSGNIDFEADYNGIFRDDITGGTSLYLNDWNGDGSTDVMWYDAVSGKNRWFLNQGRVQNKITFTVEKDKIRTSDLAGGGKIQFGDWNADGITDFLWYDNTTGNNNWFVS
ncbi:MAG: FG-GAP-like repeat-containing protein, partial [Cyclobacteriaceae bacterium]|nr:FG-GAP-like repeat-containing protein [Cyclobacteriaceae bacterium]